MAEKPFRLPGSDESMLDTLAPGLDKKDQFVLMTPREFYELYHVVMSETERALSHAYQVLDKLNAWRRPMNASQYIQKIDKYVQELNAFSDNLRDEIMAALKIQNPLILDTEQESTAYISKLAQQPRVAAHNILVEYRVNLAAIESELNYTELIQEK